MKYKNCARISRTYYGISIKPGEIKEFPGYINDKNFFKVDNEKSEVKTKHVGRPKSSQNNDTPSIKAEKVKEKKEESEAKVVKDQTKPENTGGES